MQYENVMRSAVWKSVFAAILLLGLAPAFAEVGWRNDGTGRFDAANPPRAWSTGQNVVWKAELPGGSIASPVIVGDRVFVGSGDGKFYEFSLETGEVKWSFETGAPIVGSAAVAEGRLLIGDQDGILYCFGQGT